MNTEKMMLHREPQASATRDVREARLGGQQCQPQAESALERNPVWGRGDKGQFGTDGFGMCTHHPLKRVLRAWKRGQRLEA